MTGAAVPGQLRRGPAVTMGHSVLSGVVEGGDHKAGRARPAGRARLRDAVNSWLEETSFRAALTASATALVLIGAAVAFARLLRPRLQALLCLRRIPSRLRPVPGPAAGTATGTAVIVTAEPRPTRSPGPGRTHLPG